MSVVYVGSVIKLSHTLKDQCNQEMKVFSLSELFQRPVEHIRLHHGGRQHHRRHQDGLGRLPQALQGRQAREASQEESERGHPPLHLRPVFQGKCNPWKLWLHMQFAFF